MSARAISAIESGVRKAPYRATVRRLASALVLSLEEVDRFERAATAARTQRDRSFARLGSAFELPVRPPVVGRRGSTAAIASLLGRHRLVTLTGFGGVGKTCIALDVARRMRQSYPGGTYVVDCAALSGADGVATAISIRMGVAYDPAAPLDSLIDALASRTTLILLDTCEVGAEAVGSVVDAVMRTCPNVSFLATSRRRLMLSSEFVHHVEPLGSIRNPPGDGEPADLRRALVRRGLRSMSSAQRSQHDGIPLLVEMEAEGALGRHRELSAIPDRQRTPTSNLDWSASLLGEPERTLLRRLSIFEGDFEARAVTAVCASDDDSFALAALSALVDASLVNARECSGAVRYSLFATTRAYAERKCEAAGETAMLAARFARWSNRQSQPPPRKERKLCPVPK